MDAEIKMSSSENPELSKVLFLKAGGQNIAFHTSPATRTSAFRISLYDFCLFVCFTMYFPSGFSHAKFALLSPGKPAKREWCYPNYGACWVFLFFHSPPDYIIFNVRTDVNACDYTHRGEGTP